VAPQARGDRRRQQPSGGAHLRRHRQRAAIDDPERRRVRAYASSEYSELSLDGDGWRLRTLDNLSYKFEPSSAVAGGHVDDDLWLLTEIRDLTGTETVRLRYAANVCTDSREVNLASIAYTFNDDDKPLYEIVLSRRREPWRSACVRVVVVDVEQAHAPASAGLHEHRGPG